MAWRLPISATQNLPCVSSDVIAVISQARRLRGCGRCLHAFESILLIAVALPGSQAVQLFGTCNTLRSAKLSTCMQGMPLVWYWLRRLVWRRADVRQRDSVPGRSAMLGLSHVSTSSACWCRSLISGCQRATFSDDRPHAATSPTSALLAPPSAALCSCHVASCHLRKSQRLVER